MISGLGLLVAGGQAGSSGLDVVEMINLETFRSCVVDVKLDQPRYDHTGNGNLVCSGSNGNNRLSSCYNIVTGDTINLINERYNHLSWSTGHDLYLMGGKPSSNLRTTKLITGDSTQPGFRLKYKTL